jgi:hypothetical protein
MTREESSAGVDVAWLSPCWSGEPQDKRRKVMDPSRSVMMMDLFIVTSPWLLLISLGAGLCPSRDRLIEKVTVTLKVTVT